MKTEEEKQVWDHARCCYPDLDNLDSTALREALVNELADLQMCIRHLTETYMHFSAGRISKATTLPQEVFSVAEELAEEARAEESDGDW